MALLIRSAEMTLEDLIGVVATGVSATVAADSIGSTASVSSSMTASALLISSVSLKMNFVCCCCIVCSLVVGVTNAWHDAAVSHIAVDIVAIFILLGLFFD